MRGKEGRRERGREEGCGEKRNRVIVRQRNNMRCIPTTNRECIRCQYHYTKQTLTMATWEEEGEGNGEEEGRVEEEDGKGEEEWKSRGGWDGRGKRNGR